MSPLLSFIVSYVVLRWMLSARIFRLVVDYPNDRSLHTNPIPRTGGLGVMAGVLAGWSLLSQLWLLPAILGVLALMILSFNDDVRGVSAGVRFFIHFLVAAGFFWGMHLTEAGWLLMPLLVVAMVWMTNLYNFMDGSDGLAGGMAFFGFGSYALAAWLTGDQAMMMVNLVVACAAIAFLKFNFYPARIFMGDAGSIPLGFLSGALGLIGWHRGLWPLWFPLLVFSPFVVDASVTLVRRLWRREKVWHAHREHYYQRLVQIGWGHRRTALVEYTLMLVAGSSAVLALHQSVAVQVALGLGWMLAYWKAMEIIDSCWAAYQDKKNAKS